MHDGYWHDGMGGGWWWIPMALMMVAFWGGLAWIAVTLIRRTNPTAHHHGPAHDGPTVPPIAGPPAVDAKQILAERLARGDIEIDDYHTRMAALDGKSRS